MEERIIELETRLTYQDDLVQKLDEVIIKQQKEIDEIKVLLKRMNQQLNETIGQELPGEEGPTPHY